MDNRPCSNNCMLYVISCDSNRLTGKVQDLTTPHTTPSSTTVSHRHTKNNTKHRYKSNSAPVTPTRILYHPPHENIKFTALAGTVKHNISINTTHNNRKRKLHINTDDTYLNNDNYSIEPMIQRRCTEPIISAIEPIYNESCINELQSHLHHHTLASPSPMIDYINQYEYNKRYTNQFLFNQQHILASQNNTLSHQNRSYRFDYNRHTLSPYSTPNSHRYLLNQINPSIYTSSHQSTPMHTPMSQTRLVPQHIAVPAVTLHTPHCTQFCAPVSILSNIPGHILYHNQCNVSLPNTVQSYNMTPLQPEPFNNDVYENTVNNSNQ